ncbi:RlpA-like double-psi beta-barrel-protein domain-containing protein-containing protein [Mycena leptocephala]|nr:RlpA-like double-psi beta-barrel-protein domain-containing protein-containing protein [Mycena leptocephala]
MLSFVVLALAAASASAHSFSHLRRHHVPRTQPPAGWATNYLEVYDVYHERYTAIGCENKHNSTFFDFCCHPLLATETVAKNRPACCAVGATAACPGTPSSSSVAAPASTGSAGDEECDDEGDSSSDDDDNTDDEEDCQDEDDNNNNDNSDDGEDDCDDGEESSAPATPTKVATTSHAAVVTTSTHTTTPTTTSVHTTPTTTSTHTTPKTTSTTVKATTTSTAASSDKTSSSFFTGGFGTWFTQNGVAGACGKVHKDTDFVVALQTKTYAKGANCGRTIRVTNLSNGKTVDGLVADECPTCTNSDCVDMSLKMFESLAALSVGEFDIKWQFLD